MLAATVSTDPRLMQMFNVRMSEAVVDYFVYRLTAAVARATIAQPYKAAFELKTYHLLYFVHSVIVGAELDMQVVLTAIVYLDRMRLDELWAYGDQYICERLTVGALKTAQKWCHDERHHYSKWTGPSYFGRQDIDVMERHFLQLIDYSCWASPGAYLDHYAPFMQYVNRLNAFQAGFQRPSIFPPRKAEEQRIFLSEVDDSIELVSVPEPAYKSAADLPNLTYPESPLSSPMSMSDDGFDDAVFSSDDDSSDESPEVVTPPDAARHCDTQPATVRAATNTNTDAEHATSDQANPDQFYLDQAQQKARVAEREARIRFYAADHGTVVDPCGSPQYVPPSPSNMDMHHRAQERKESQTQTFEGTQPWHQMQIWRSAGLSGDTTWGTLGLFT